MRREEFKLWLVNERKLKVSVANSRVGNISTIESYYDDVDILIQNDCIYNLLDELSYSTEDERYNRPQKHKIPIQGNIRTGSSTLKQALCRYIEFSKATDKYDYPKVTNHANTKKTETISNQEDDVEIIDGMNVLITKLGGTYNFINLIISGCIFFSPDDVSLVFDKMASHMENQIPVPARLSTKKEYYGKKLKRKTQEVLFNCKDEISGDILVKIDGNGNAHIDKMIRDLTGYSLKKNNNKRPDIVNLKISHIWGKAYHPSYFTSLWNIVLVPTFGNDLLDKPSASDGTHLLGSILLNTIKAILIKLFKMQMFSWSKIRICECPTYDPEMVAYGNYSINVFNHRIGREKVNIDKVNIDLRRFDS